jgi:multiple sugar transport system ATP-binding protein
VSRVDLNKVWKIYPRGNVVGVKDLTFTIQDKEFLAILGPSGGGKSSTLRMLAGLEEISRGEIRFDGKVVNELGPAERNIALAFESYALYQRLSVYENIAFPLRARKMKKAAVHEKVSFIAELLDLKDLLKKYPPSLAGGQQQRVSLARAFVRQPNLTLLDEPISHMDQRVRAEIRARIRHLHDEMKNTTVYVTHDQAEAVSLCDRMVILHKAELQQIGTVEEIWNHPANRFVAFFVGEPAMNFLPASVEGERGVSVASLQGRRSLALPAAVPAKYSGRELTLGLRPQQLKVNRQDPGGGSLPGKVRLIEFQGETTVLTLAVGEAGGAEMKAVVAATERYAPGETVWLAPEAKNLHLFDGEESILKK